jgi:two-component system, cell cycle sensor histidine kinase and response regulator CckA
MTKVLVVDDVSANIAVLTWMLAHQGYTVISATSGRQALEMVADEMPDVILLDVSMPEMSGIEVCQKLKADPYLRLIPIILVTALTSDEDLVSGLNAGADDYIAKPVTRQVLSARLRSALRIKAVYDELGDANEQLRREMAERITAEEELRHAQKLELVGQLAGGIAHEFNNLLQAIEGYTAYAMQGLSPEESQYQDLQQVLKASSRATSLTRQLLGFSRRRNLEKKIVDLNRVVADLARMIRPLIGAHIQLETNFDPEIGTVCADPGELQQALLNLCLNARDAMPSGGSLVLRTQSGPCRWGECKTSRSPSAMIQVIDTGSGMSAETQQRIFEPFFTTKAASKGTGLGLANFYGIVRQHGGEAHVESALGKGSTFTLCLPAVETACVGELTEDPAAVGGGAETILLAEDDESVRSLAQRILEQAGYTVLVAVDGAEALRLFRQNRAAIDLVLLDAVMPKTSGSEASAQIRLESPETKIILASGYALETVLAGIKLGPDIRVIAKPFDSATLLRTVRDVMEESHPWPISV